VTSENQVHFAGTVHDAAWTSYGRGLQGCVNFWLAISRELAGDGFDLVQCAIEHKTGEEIDRLKMELHAGRTVHVVGSVRSRVRADASLLAQKPEAVFIASEVGLDGEAPRCAHNLGKPRRVMGKMAAAHDDSGAEFVLSAEVQT
jgi:hypothetical protein